MSLGERLQNLVPVLDCPGHIAMRCTQGLPRLFLLCLAYTLCSAGVPGTEFITAFMQNYNNAADTDLKLSITAFSDSTTVQIKVNTNTFRKTVSLNQFEETTVVLPHVVLMKGSQRSTYSVIVTSNNPVSVVSMNFNDQSFDSSSLYPVSEWGTEYYVFTPPDGSFKEFAIIAKEPSTSVTISPTGTLNYLGKNYNSGSTLTFKLDAYEVIQFQSEDDLSGSRIISSKKVTVLSGHTCSMKFTKCNHVYEQLQASYIWGTTFFIPTVSFQTKYDLVYVTAATQNTQVTYQAGSVVQNKELDAGDVIEIQLKASAPIFINSTEGIQVMYYSTGGQKGAIDYDTALMTVPDVTSFCTSFRAVGLDDFINEVLIVAKTSALDDLTVNKAPQGNISWKPIPGTQYSWGELTLVTNSKPYIFESKKSPFGLSVIGTSSSTSYAESAVCIGGSSRPSCSQVKCNRKEVCKIVHGKAVCQSNSEATCWAWGDPHYHTFDGKNYDFQGTCSYTMSKTCSSNLDLPYFNIETKNEIRATSSVSYLKSVNIQVYGFNITGFRSEYGVVRVNNQKSQLPVQLLDGKLTISQSGTSLILLTDYKLKVIYDWDILLKITIPGSYYTNVCGLCGNYNDNQSDDLSNGGVALSTIDYGKLWKVQDNSDPSCWDDCNGPCVTCTPDQKLLYGSSENCGILRSLDGPFKVCHDKIDSVVFKENCVYDLCLNQGFNQVLCQTLKAYSDACAREGIQVGDWRNATGCPMICPGNSTYNQRGSACPATCQDPAAPSKCTDASIETCECVSGFVLIEGKCQPIENCGCTYQGRSYPQNASFWDDTVCKRKCVCNPDTHKVQCSNTKCATGQRCFIQDGILDCYATTTSTCSGSGDPHYITFDNLHYDFQGACHYLLSGLCKPKSYLPDFQVTVRNENQGSLFVSYTTAITFKVFEREIQVLREYPGVVLVDGVKSNLPLALRPTLGNIDIYQSGRQCIIQTNIGIRVTFDWEARVGVTLPSTYFGSVCGLCGNYNNNSNDDLINRDGQLQPNVTLFGHSWREGENADTCKIVKENNCSNLLAMEAEQKKNLQECGMVLDKKGPFRNCQAKVDPASYFQDCVYDMCAYGKRPDLICRLLTGYTASCQEAGVSLYPWRSDIICPITCPLNSRYSICVNGCPSTCHSMTMSSKCDAQCREGCECEQGYVLSGSDCVPMSQCGCIYNEKYYKSGEIFYPEDTCENKCTCSNGGAVICEHTSCRPYENCSVVNGVQNCNPVGSSVCSAMGKTSYSTFDNLGYDFIGNCSYTLTKTCLTGNSTLTPFLVQMRNLESRASANKNIWLEVYNYTITISQGDDNKILVNDIQRNLPFEVEAGRLRAEYQGGGIVLKTDFGLIITSDNAIHVTVPGNYHNQLCGLCGNYNDDLSDDLGPYSDDVVSFADSLKESDEVCSTSEVCNAGNQTCCPKAKQREFSGQNFCGVLTDPSGPFSSCHSVFDPAPYMQSCVSNLCSRSGELCPILQGYVKVCQDAGAVMKPWRSPSYCPYTCSGENSHYEFCADVCTTSCSSLYDITVCPKSCTEGCQCDEGYFFQNNLCVTADICNRCTLNATFYMINETVISEDCSQSCTCTSHHVMDCQLYDCNSDEVCRILDGKVQCINQNPCKSVTCRNKEHCVNIDEKPVCVPDYTSSCTAWGDPHYTTFDGYNFDFHGTCTYVLATYIGADTTLEFFRIEEKNDNRGSATSSSVRLVNIFVYNFNISIVKEESGQVRVNDEIANLPLTLLNGKITVTYSGVYAVLKTDFGLQVSYDYNWHVEVTIPSSYYASTGGLCGNFNTNPRDDKVSPDNEKLTIITKWAQSWKVIEDDDFCWDVCHGTCLECNETSQALYEGEQFCGVMEADNGPFVGCQRTVNTSLFLDNCVKDICSHDGVGFCQALEAYAAACRKQGVDLPDWRNATGCNMVCPENSHYEYCATACPASCFDKAAPDRCTEPCVESCQCDEGHVSSAGSCIDVMSCGCYYNNLYYKPSQEFWSDDTCSVLCRCDPSLGVVVCTEQTCQGNTKCMIRNGIRDCYPVSYFTCISTGDPHYTTFDGQKYDFMGTCIYQMTEVCIPDPNLTPFRVKIQNEKRGGKDVSYTKSVTLEAYNQTITLTRDYPHRVVVNGVANYIPWSMKSNKIKTFMNGEHAFVRTDFDVTVNYNWDNYARVIVPNTYAEALCGLCGNFNQDPSDDLTPADDKKGGIKFADRYKVGETPGCSGGCKGECPKCSDQQTLKYSNQTYCGILSKKDGPLSSCYETIDPTSYFTDCVYDSCQYMGQYSAVCGAIARYVTECQEKGIEVGEWRKYTICEPFCPQNSHYELCGPGCHASCSSIYSASDCKKTCTEGCYCDSNFVLSGDTCVSISQCGCDFNNTYHQRGDIFYPEEQCNEQCQCEDNGVVQCQAAPCGPNEECALVNGVISCHSKITGTCLGAGNSHFQSFDGLSFIFQGSCSYTLAEVCSKNVELGNFSVVALSDYFGQSNILGTSALRVNVHDYEITMERGKPWQVKVNEEDHNLPLVLENGKIQINQEGSSIVLQTDFELIVLYDLVNSVHITVPGVYQSSMCGLCGDFNGKLSDDLRMPSGQLSTSVEEFGAAWNADPEVTDCSCKENCKGCEKMRAAIFSRDEACGLLVSGYGPFVDCYNLINATDYFNQCLFDMCASDGQADTLCDSLQAYATACQASGANIKQWKSPTFCSPDCPENSHYELCARTCDVTCSGVIAPAFCTGRCSEGCECDDGYLFDGGSCVSMDKCGCFYNGIYYNEGESFVNEDCSLQCKCQAGGVTCTAVSCTSKQRCGLVSGVRGCYMVDGECSVNPQKLVTFDGLSGGTIANGLLEVASLCNMDASEWFRVLADIQSCGQAPSVSRIHIFLPGGLVTISKDKEVWVNGRLAALPTVFAFVSANTGDSAVIIQVGTDLKIELSNSGNLLLWVSEGLSESVCGVCGNFNGDTFDDLRAPGGKVVKDILQLIASWRAYDFNSCNV
ncbi:IgGFc-binding protein-like isoform X2 [Pseudophryne corroboree]|uniref:IgGFc-binding protein-like isoform X2 n=1 Tax=Pseudophryne corroboree TaxID=495146 RepID=UPI003081FE80